MVEVIRDLFGPFFVPIFFLDLGPSIGDFEYILDNICPLGRVGVNIKKMNIMSAEKWLSELRCPVVQFDRNLDRVVIKVFVVIPNKAKTSKPVDRLLIPGGIKIVAVNKGVET